MKSKKTSKSKSSVGKIIGIGGIFLKSKDPKKMKTWYEKNLGMPLTEWGGYEFIWRHNKNPKKKGYTVWSLMPADTKYMSPGKASFMINYRVDNLAEVLKKLKKMKANVEEKIEVSEFGKFGWVIDPEGNKIELWEPNDDYVNK